MVNSYSNSRIRTCQKCGHKEYREVFADASGEKWVAMPGCNPAPITAQIQDVELVIDPVWNPVPNFQGYASHRVNGVKEPRTEIVIDLSIPPWNGEYAPPTEAPPKGAENPWRPVPEYVPGPGERVLVATSFGVQIAARSAYRDACGNYVWYFEAMAAQIERDASRLVVTHWMPLPEPPA